MFTRPLSLNAIGTAAGLTAPISMSQLRGRTIYDSGGTATVTGATSISLSVFENKTFTSPVNPIIFTSSKNGTISEAGKKFSYNTGDDTTVGINNGNTTPFYLNVRYIGLYGFSYVYIINDRNLFYLGATTALRSFYFTNGYTLANSSIFATYPEIFEVTISNTPAAGYTVVNFVY